MKVTLLKERVFRFSLCISFCCVIILHCRLHRNILLSKNNVRVSQIDDFLLELGSRDSLLESSWIDVLVELIVVVCSHDDIWWFRKVMMMSTHFSFLSISLMLEIFLNWFLRINEVVRSLDCRAIWA